MPKTARSIRERIDSGTLTARRVSFLTRLCPFITRCDDRPEHTKEFNVILTSRLCLFDVAPITSE